MADEESIVDYMSKLEKYDGRINPDTGSLEYRAETNGYSVLAIRDNKNTTDMSEFGLWVTYCDGDTREGCEIEMDRFLGRVTAVTVPNLTYGDLEELEIVR